MRAFKALLFVLGYLSLLAYGMNGGDGQMVPATSDTGGAVALRSSRLHTTAQVAVAAATAAFVGAAKSSPPLCRHIKTQDEYCDMCAAISCLPRQPAAAELQLMEEDREDRGTPGDYDNANSELDEDRGDIPGRTYDQFSLGGGSGSDEEECGGSCFSGSTATGPGPGRREARKNAGREKGTETRTPAPKQKPCFSTKRTRSENSEGGVMYHGT